MLEKLRILKLKLRLRLIAACMLSFNTMEKGYAAFNKLDFESLILLLNHKNSFIRADTVLQLGNLGDLRAVEPLLQRLNDPDIHVTTRAADALGVLGDPRAVDPILSLLRESYGDRLDWFEKDIAGIRISFISALGKLGDPGVLPDLLWIQEHDRTTTKRGTPVENWAESVIQKLQKQQSL